MKGIYIEGIKIPENCDECFARAMALAYCQLSRKSTSHTESCKPMDQTKRPKWCRLQEVDKEEVLIGRDVVRRAVEEWKKIVMEGETNEHDRE